MALILMYGILRGAFLFGGKKMIKASDLYEKRRKPFMKLKIV